MKARELVRAVIGFTLFLFLTPAILFIAAGTADWPMAWVYVALLLASSIGSRLIVWKRNPDTLRERAQFASGEGAKDWDRLLVVIVGLFGPMIIMLIAGLDHRYGWGPRIPLSIQYTAAIATATGYGLAVWAMVANPFFSAVARIQKDRGQVVVTGGPYSLVRHPSYAGALVAGVAIPIMLDALWALIPAVIMCVAVIIRTKFEDRMLVEELEGYTDYAEKTRFRLIPGVW